MRVTAATITNEQILEVRKHAETWASREHQGRGVRDQGLWDATHVALGSNGRQACLDRGHSITPLDRERAREMVARDWNSTHVTP